MRIVGVLLILFGFLISLSIVGAVVGIPMIFIGLIMVVVGGRRKTVITNVVQVSNNAGTPQFSMDHDDRDERPRYARAPSLKSEFGSRPAMGGSRAAPQISKPPEFEPTYDHMEFTDVRSELSEDSRRVLAMAKADGYDVKARPDSLTLKKGDFQLIVRSNDEIYEFGRAHGFQ